MKKMKLCLFAVLISFALAALSGCKTGGETIYLYNWQDYMDPAVLEMFKEETGITVVEDTFDTNESMYVKVSKSGGYDVIVPSDYMIERMINENLLEKINMDNIPNYSHIDGAFKGLEYDPGNEYSVSYMWGTLGIMYDSSRIDEPVESWDILWNPEYKGQIYMYNSVRDTLGVALVRLGYSLNTKDSGELSAAVESLKEQKPLVQAYLGDPVKDKMIAGEGLLALVYSGDALFCQGENENLMYTIPEEGSNLFVDALCIPKTAKNKEAAEKFINFLCRPDIAAMNSEYIGYTTTNRDAIPYMDEDFTSNPIFWAADEELARCETFGDLGDFRAEYEKAWNEVLVSK